MKVVKKYLLFSVVLFFYIVSFSLLFQQFSLYQQAYRTLSMLITNPSIEVVEEFSQIEEQEE